MAAIEQEKLATSWLLVCLCRKLAGRLEDNYLHRTLETVNNCALGIYIHKTVDAFARMTKVIAIDATYGINNAGMQLFAVSELDGTEVPFAYHLVGKDTTSASVFLGNLMHI